MKLRHVRGQDIRRHPSNRRKLERERERENEKGGEEKNKRGRGGNACIRFEGMELRIT